MLAVRPAPASAEALARLYERLRGESRPARQGEVSTKLGLLAREGMAAWAVAVATADKSTDDGPSRERPPEPTLPAPARRELVWALTSLVHGGAQRQEHM